jgi:membrane protease YdiL (CAAX protease family)
LKGEFELHEETDPVQPIVGGEARPLQPRRLSWQAWVALAYVIFAYPVGWGNFLYIHPGFDAVVTNGSRWGWYSLWGTIVVIEWVGFLLCLWALHSEGRAASEIGLYSRRLRLYVVIFIVAVTGFGAIFVAKALNWIPSRPADPHAFLPFTSTPEHFFWLAISITAAICEETMFRGFAITYLRRLLRSTWLAVLLSTLVFAYMHGGLRQGAAKFGVRFVLGLVFAGIYLWRKSLPPAMLLHFLIDAAFALQ